MTAVERVERLIAGLEHVNRRGNKQTCADLREVVALAKRAETPDHKAVAREWSAGLERAARHLECVFDQPTMAADIRALKRMSRKPRAKGKR